MKNDLLKNEFVQYCTHVLHRWCNCNSRGSCCSCSMSSRPQAQQVVGWENFVDTQFARVVRPGSQEWQERAVRQVTTYILQYKVGVQRRTANHHRWWCRKKRKNPEEKFIIHELIKKKVLQHEHDFHQVAATKEAVSSSASLADSAGGGNSARRHRCHPSPGCIVFQ